MKEKGVVLRIKKDRDWGEYQVQWWEDGKLDEGKTYHTDTPDDAVFSMMANYEWGKNKGYDIKITNAQKTRRLLNEYGPSYKGDFDSRDFPNWGEGFPEKK